MDSELQIDETFMIEGIGSKKLSSLNPEFRLLIPIKHMKIFGVLTAQVLILLVSSLTCKPAVTDVTYPQ